MCGFIAHLIKHCTGIMEVMGSNPVEALITQIGKFTAMITLHFQLQLQYKYELFHIYISHHVTAQEDMNLTCSQCVAS